MLKKKIIFYWTLVLSEHESLESIESFALHSNFPTFVIMEQKPKSTPYA